MGKGGVSCFVPSCSVFFASKFLFGGRKLGPKLCFLEASELIKAQKHPSSPRLSHFDQKKHDKGRIAAEFVVVASRERTDSHERA